MSSEFSTASAAAENAREEKTVLTLHVVAAEVELKPKMILLLNDTLQLHRRPKIWRLSNVIYTKSYCYNLVGYTLV